MYSVGMSLLALAVVLLEMFMVEIGRLGCSSYVHQFHSKSL